VRLGELMPHSRSAPVMGPAALTTLEEVQREHILRVLEQANWLIGGPSGAAAMLGMKRTTLQSKMTRLGIESPVIARARASNRERPPLGQACL